MQDEQIQQLGQQQSTQKVQATISARIIRADGSVEELGVLSDEQSQDPKLISFLQDKLNKQ